MLPFYTTPAAPQKPHSLPAPEPAVSVRFKFEGQPSYYAHALSKEKKNYRERMRMYHKRRDLLRFFPPALPAVGVFFFFFSYSVRLITHVQFQFINFRHGTHARCPSNSLADNAHDLASKRGFGWASAHVSASTWFLAIVLRMFTAHSSASQNPVRMLQC